MWEVLKYLAFMALGGFLVHISWLHAWRMYKKGKAEGQSQNGASQNYLTCPPAKGGRTC